LEKIIADVSTSAVLQCIPEIKLDGNKLAETDCRTSAPTSAPTH